MIEKLGGKGWCKMFEIQIVKFDLLGNLKDGFDNNGGTTIAREVTKLDLDKAGKLAERLARRSLEITLPTNEAGTGTRTIRGYGLTIDWSDEYYADINSKNHGVCVGAIYITEV